MSSLSERLPAPLRRTWKILAALLLIAVLIAAYSKSELALSQFTIADEGGMTAPVTMPFFDESRGVGTYLIGGTLEAPVAALAKVRIVPDDQLLALRLNGQELPLNEVPEWALKDYRNGFVYDLSPYLKPGANRIEGVVRQEGGPMGLSIAPAESNPVTRALQGVIGLLALFVFWELLGLTSLRRPLRALLLGALAVRLLYFAVTPADIRTHDLGDHFDYILHMTREWLPPNVAAATDGAYFHPPLYYYTGAVVHELAGLIAPHDSYFAHRAIQLLSLAYAMGFLLFGLLILDRILGGFRSRQHKWFGEAVLWTSGALMVFWPSAILHSVRIGNDPALYFFFGAGLYWMLRWYQDDTKRDLILAALFTALAILTKANGSVLVAVAGCLLAARVVRERKIVPSLKLFAVPMLIVVLGLGITWAPGIILKMEGKRKTLYVDNIDKLSKANLVGNMAGNYLWFDAKTFITEPFTSPYDDRYGRQFFWNYLGKTGLYGEFDYPQKICRNSAMVGSFLAVAMFLWAAVGLYFGEGKDVRRLAVPILSAFFLWAGVTYMRMTFPANIDFRYIVPIIISTSVLYGAALIHFERKGAIKMAVIGIGLAWLFVGSSVVFVAGLLG